MLPTKSAELKEKYEKLHQKIGKSNPYLWFKNNLYIDNFSILNKYYAIRRTYFNKGKIIVFKFTY